jgi:S-DNA-T family DNA segregation ATPase FtsK/SpoIIIE
LIDPVEVELKKYDGLPHLIAPVITGTAQVLTALQDVGREIERRYQALARGQARDIAGYNQKAVQAGRAPMPYLVIIIDNLVDLMLDAPKDLEQVLARIAQKARGAGVHLVLATLRTNVSTLAGSIKANFPGRIAFRVADKTDSQLILDMAGAEKLLGQGDMLLKRPEAGQLERVQGVYVAETELARIVDFWGPY